MKTAIVFFVSLFLVQAVFAQQAALEPTEFVEVSEDMHPLIKYPDAQEVTVDHPTEAVTTPASQPRFAEVKAQVQVKAPPKGATTLELLRAEQELGAVFSGIIGSLMTNMISKHSHILRKNLQETYPAEPMIKADL
eukprot:GILJ01000297.1.p1 GENE.GILJ01000297.1~~GILJ01000297.1.p1  ORF type:complete len:154 (+),score=35.51 GILJ01000297.1:55-462(+)